MNKILKSNIYSLIEVYILNEKLIPTYKNLISYNSLIKKVFDDSNISKEIAGKIILDFYIDKVEKYFIETGNFPHKVNLLNYSCDYKTIFSVFSGKYENKYEVVMLNYFYKILKKPTNTKMKKALQEQYLINKNLFEEFFLLNLDKANISSQKFQSVGHEIRSIIADIEEFVVGRMEGGQYGVFSGSTRDKLMSFIKSFFPLYDHIGVKCINNNNFNILLYKL